MLLLRAPRSQADPHSPCQCHGSHALTPGAPGARITRSSHRAPSTRSAGPACSPASAAARRRQQLVGLLRRRPSPPGSPRSKMAELSRTQSAKQGARNLMHKASDKMRVAGSKLGGGDFKVGQTLHARVGGGRRAACASARHLTACCAAPRRRTWTSPSSRPPPATSTSCPRRSTSAVSPPGCSLPAAAGGCAQHHTRAWRPACAAGRQPAVHHAMHWQLCSAPTCCAATPCSAQGRCALEPAAPRRDVRGHRAAQAPAEQHRLAGGCISRWRPGAGLWLGQAHWRGRGAEVAGRRCRGHQLPVRREGVHSQGREARTQGQGSWLLELTAGRPPPHCCATTPADGAQDARHHPPADARD